MENGEATNIYFTPYSFRSFVPTEKSNRQECFSENSKNYEDNSSSMPPSYDSIFGQFKEDKEISASSLEYLKTVFTMFAGTVVCTLSLMFLLSLPMSMIVIGSKYKDMCPIEPFIPIYLIVGGSVGVVKMVSVITQRTAYNGGIFGGTNSDESETSEDDRPIAWLFVDGVLNIFLFTWFVAGNIWVYSKYCPNFEPPPHEPLNYCNKTVYLFSFWVITTSYLILGMICFCTCCLALCASCTAFILAASSKETNVENENE